MDVNKLRTLVFEKTGVKVDSNDPIFALVALNEVVLAECVEQHVALMLDATDNLGAQTGRLIEAGEHYTKVLQQIAAVTENAPPAELAAVLTKELAPPEPARRTLAIGDLKLAHWLAGLGGAALLSSLLTVGGVWAFARPSAPPPVAAVPAPASVQLTPEQMQMIQNGEKYAKMWPKLDAATQAKIQKIVQPPQ